MANFNCTSLCGATCESIKFWDRSKSIITPCGELILSACILVPYFAMNIFYLTLFINQRRHLFDVSRARLISDWMKILTFASWPFIFIMELICILLQRNHFTLPAATIIVLCAEIVATCSHCLLFTSIKIYLINTHQLLSILFSLINFAFLIFQLYDNFVLYTNFNAIAIGHIIVIGSHAFYLAALLLDVMSSLADQRSSEEELLNGRPIADELDDGDQLASCLSNLTFFWTNRLMKKGYLGRLTSVDDLFKLPNRLNTKLLSKVIEKKLAKGQRSFLKLLHSGFAWEFYSLGVLKFLSDSLSFAGPLLLSYLITFMESPDEPNYQGYLYAAGMFATSFLSSSFGTHFNYKMNVVGLKLRSSVITTIYDKIFKVQQAELELFSSGRIINFMGTDADRVVNFVRSFHDFWSLPMQIGIALYLLYREVELAFLAGLGFALLLIPINRWIAQKIGSYSTEMMFYKDQRIKTVSEMLHGVRIVKFCSWEENFRQKIIRYRRDEVKYLKGRKYLDALCVYLWASAPVVVAILTFATYILMGHSLTAAKVFTSLALFNILITPLNAFPWVVNGVVEAWVSVKRLQSFFDLKEFDSDTFFDQNCHYHPTSEICLHDSNFTWFPDCSISTLTNLNLDVKRGQLVGIIGSVGAGKSSLFAAILGEIKKVKGQICVRSRRNGLAYVGQEAWLQHGTVKSNILFGLPYHKDLYDRVIAACALTVDFQQMPHGDSSEVGEQGVTLSGGQKTRIALARAVYQNKDVYLLDDPLSAVDAQVARHMFEHCVCNLLKDKLVVLATHHVHFLKKADVIIVISGGKISAQGSPDEIWPAINNLQLESKSESASSKASHDEISNADVGGGEPVLLRDEEREVGGVKLAVYLVYFSSIGSCLTFFVFMALLLMQISKNLSDWWLSYWVENTRNSTNSFNYSNFEAQHFKILSEFKYPYHILLSGQFHDDSYELDDMKSMISDGVKYYLTVYAILAGINSFLTLIRSFSFAYGGISAAKNLHTNLLDSILKAPVRFFDVTPAGRIVNRFATDCYSVDDSLPFQANRLVMYIFAVAGTLIMTIYGLPWFGICILPVGLLYFYIQRYYRRTTCELKRLNSTTLSPIFSHFTDTLNGLAVIRAFKKSNKFTMEFHRILTENQRVQYSLLACGSWLAVRLQMMGVFMIAAVATIAVLEHQFRSVNAGLVGLAISYALSITSLLSGLLQAFTETEKEMVAVERISDYVKNVPHEKFHGTIKISCNWPGSGKIVFTDVSLRYASDLPLALDRITFTINPAEKVGVVGRTGSGKSSLFQALFRTVELESGSVFVDGVDISFLGLQDLRSKLSIIPQSPFLFSGSLRDNLDISAKYSDAQVLKVVEACGLSTLVDRLGNLNGEVGEKGSGLSMGERQLVCLARALLIGAKVVCIDEATAHVDMETDTQIQRSLREFFPTATIMTIAHRINTVMDYDRVLVMDKGKIVEFDSPQLLIQDVSSRFYQFAKHL